MLQVYKARLSKTFFWHNLEDDSHITVVQGVWVPLPQPGDYYILVYNNVLLAWCPKKN